MVTKQWEEFLNDDKNTVVFAKVWFVFQTKDNSDCKKHKRR